MATKHSHDLPDELFVEASLWHARMREPEVSDHDRKAFSSWLSRNPKHPDAYQAVERLWAALDEPVKGLVAEQLSSSFFAPLREEGKKRHESYWGVLAASLILVVTIGAWWRRGGLDNLRSDYVASVGQHESLTLTDGSHVMLNTDTAVALDFTLERRTVRLFRGEAYFQIAKDEFRPFFVQTPKGAVRVVGTEFNVRMLNYRTVVSVFRGQVDVVSTSANQHASATRLVAGEETSFDQAGVSQVGGLDATRVAAWRRKQVVFYGTPLEDVVRELNRYHHGRIVVLGDRLRGLLVTGVFDATKPTEVIEVIERTLNVTTTRFTDYLIFLR